MPTRIRQLTPNGELLPVSYQAESLKAASEYEPEDSIYTVFNTFNTTEAIKLDAHLDRMEDSAQRADIPLELNRAHLRAGVRRVIEEANFGDVRVRVTVPRIQPDTFIISVEPYTPPDTALTATGVKTITAPNSARQNARVKNTEWMFKRKALEEAMPPDVYDTFLLDADGYILEGLGSNFFAILNGELRTANDGVLKGIAQQIVFEVADQILPVNLTPVHVSQITDLQEAFLTSSSRGIIPIIEIDGINIGSGHIGEKTSALQQAYLEWVDAHKEPI